MFTQTKVVEDDVESKAILIYLEGFGELPFDVVNLCWKASRIT